MTLVAWLIFTFKCDFFTLWPIQFWCTVKPTKQKHVTCRQLLVRNYRICWHFVLSCFSCCWYILELTSVWQTMRGTHLYTCVPRMDTKMWVADQSIETCKCPAVVSWQQSDWFKNSLLNCHYIYCQLVGRQLVIRFSLLSVLLISLTCKKDLPLFCVFWNNVDSVIQFICKVLFFI